MQETQNSTHNQSNFSETKSLKFIPLSKWNDFHQYPKVSTLRQLVFKNTDNFNDEVVKRIATPLYIDVDAFFVWMNKDKRQLQGV